MHYRVTMYLATCLAKGLDKVNTLNTLQDPLWSTNSKPIFLHSVPTQDAIKEWLLLGKN